MTPVDSVLVCNEPLELRLFAGLGDDTGCTVEQGCSKVVLGLSLEGIVVNLSGPEPEGTWCSTEAGLFVGIEI